MKRFLNPNLVKIAVKPDNNWVFLRDSKNIAPYNEVGIGSIEVEVVPENLAETAKFKQELRETEVALSELSGLPPDVEPHVILTHNCFGISGLVRVLIFSIKPFASSESA